MKKTFFLLFALVTIFGANVAQAQNVYVPYNSIFGETSKFSFGVKAGMTMSKIGGNPSGRTIKIGYQAGGIVDYAISRDHGIHLEAAVLLSSKGLKPDFKKNHSDLDINAMYLQIPINFNYLITLSDNLRLALKTGPYFAVGIGGKTKYQVLNENEEFVKKEIDTFGKDGSLKRFDFGWGGTVGLEVGSSFAFLVTVEQGITKVIDFGNDRVRSASIGVAYLF